MFQIAGSGNRLNIGMAPYIRASVGQMLDPYAGYLVYDTFTDTNGTTLANHTPDKCPPAAAWVDLAGVSNVVNNTAKLFSASAPEGVVIESGEADITLTCSLTVPTTHNAGVLFRAIDNNNFWLFGAIAGYWRLYKKVSSSWTLVGTGNVSTAGTYAITVVTSGNSITCTRDATQEFSVTDADLNTATKHGLCWNSNDEGTNASSQDDFGVTSP